MTLVGELAGDGHGVVGALGVDDDDLVGPADRLERRGKIAGLVARNDRDGHLLHAQQCRAGRSGEGR